MAKTAKSIVKELPQVKVIEKIPSGFSMHLYGGYAVTSNGSHSVQSVNPQLGPLYNWAKRATFCYCPFCRVALIREAMDEYHPYMDEWKNGLDDLTKPQ